MTGKDTRPPQPEEQVVADSRRWNAGRVLLVCGAVVSIIAAILYGAESNSARDEASVAVEQREDVEQEKQDLAERAIAACENAAPADVDRLRQIGLCQAAQAATRRPAPPPEVPFGAVRDAVASYFRANPVRDGKAPAPRDILGPVRQEVARQLAQNPPVDGADGQDGEPPSDERLLQLIRQVYAATPPADGEDGADGRNAFCYDNPGDPACQPATGPRGARGEPPLGWTSQHPDGSRQECRRVPDFDPQAPRYECVYDTASTPSATTGTPAPTSDVLPVPTG